MVAITEIEERRRKANPNRYRGFVGPAHQYDFMGATQFRLLCSLGLREHHRVLDFGCGSLRAGRLLIPYLQPEKYFGIEPNAWLVEDAIENQIGRDIVRIKRPQFSDSDAFIAGVFEGKFDYIIAQSIFSHAGPRMLRRALRSFGRRLEEGGLCVVTFVEGGRGMPAEGWHYPQCVTYPAGEIPGLVAEGNLVCTRIPWFHPRQTWYLLAHGQSALPSAGEVKLLHGMVLRDAEFKQSIPAVVPAA
jgi:SAM-dependent methyltransferase